MCCQSSELLKWVVGTVFSAVLSMEQIDVTNVVAAGGAQHLFSHWRLEEFHSSERAGKLSAVKYRDRLDRVPCRRFRITCIVLDVSPFHFCVLYAGPVLRTSLWRVAAVLIEMDRLRWE